MDFLESRLRLYFLLFILKPYSRDIFCPAYKVLTSLYNSQCYIHTALQTYQEKEVNNANYSCHGIKVWICLPLPIQTNQQNVIKELKGKKKGYIENENKNENEIASSKQNIDLRNEFRKLCISRKNSYWQLSRFVASSDRVLLPALLHFVFFVLSSKMKYTFNHHIDIYSQYCANVLGSFE